MSVFSFIQFFIPTSFLKESGYSREERRVERASAGEDRGLSRTWNNRSPKISNYPPARRKSTGARMFPAPGQGRTRFFRHLSTPRPFLLYSLAARLHEDTSPSSSRNSVTSRFPLVNLFIACSRPGVRFHFLPDTFLFLLLRITGLPSRQ